MKSITRGGQISFHSIRMFSQLIMTLFKWSIVFVLFGTLIYLGYNFDLYDLKLIIIYYVSDILASFGVYDYYFNFSNHAGGMVKANVKSIIHNSEIILLKNHFSISIINGLFTSFLSALIFVLLALGVFKIKGKRIGKEKFVRGANIVSAEKLARIIKIKNFLSTRSLKSFYTVSTIPFPFQSEFLHTIVLGSTGTGKTSAIMDLIDQIRKNGDRAIIYDKMGAYTSHFYNSQKDIILNPLDERSRSWNLFNEVNKDSDFDYIAAALIQDKKASNDPFWIESARRVLSVFAREIYKENPNITNQEFFDLLLKSDYKRIAKLLKNTEATSVINEDSEKTSLSILAVLSTYISSLKYLHNQSEKFSINKWVTDEEQSGFLFISSKGDQHESLKSLISAWMDIAVKSLLSVEQKEERRIWIILDELPSLQYLPSLLDGLSQSRQFGGAFVLALHSTSQLRTVYGKDATDTIISLCRNKLFFAVPDSETAEFCSENLGEQEVEEIKESVSYGANEVRDGVNLNKQKNRKKLVLASQLMQMSKLQAYIKFAGFFPISKVSFVIKNREKINPRFVEKSSKNIPIQKEEFVIEDYKVEVKEKKPRDKKSFSDLVENLNL